MLVLAPWPDFCEAADLPTASCASRETPAITGLPQEASAGPQGMRTSRQHLPPLPHRYLHPLAQQCMKFTQQGAAVA